jgi:THO complex subunit 4
MNYDRSGRSMGTAEIIYKNRADAMKAMQKYNGVPLDGKAMRLEVVNSGGIGSVSGGGRMSVPRMNSSRPVPYGGRGSSSRFTEQREPRKPREKKVEAKAEDLDADMDAYFAASNKKPETVSKPDDNDDLLDERNDLLDASINEVEDEKVSGDNVVEADGDDDINLDEEL